MMDRREYIAAISTIMASGCTDIQNASGQTRQAMERFTDVTEFDTEGINTVDQAVRFTDEEAGVVFWSFSDSSGMQSSNQLQVISRDIDNIKI